MSLNGTWNDVLAEISLGIIQQLKNGFTVEYVDSHGGQPQIFVGRNIQSFIPGFGQLKGLFVAQDPWVSPRIL